MARITTVVSILCLLAAACGSGDTSSPEETARVISATPTTPAPTLPTTATPPPPTTATTTTMPPPITTTEPRKTRLVVSATGDVNLDPTYIGALADFGYDYPWQQLQGIFESDDLTIVNFECAASDLGRAEPKQFTFRCPPESLPAMRAAGVEVANLGNNHSGDFGKEALVDSRAQLEAARIAPVGVGADVDEAHQAALFEINGWTIAVLGFGGVVPTPEWIAADDRPGMADGDTIDTMAAAVAAADEFADLVLVSIHWGAELDTTPRSEDVERAEAMIAAGADAIFGHHAHRLQPLETLAGVPVAWGLGNFVWPRFSNAGATTAVAQVVFEPDGSVISCLIPAFIETAGQPVLQVEYDAADPCRAEE